MARFRLLLFHLLLLLVAYGFCRLIVGARRRAESAVHAVRRDTLIIRDTLRVSRPVPVREEVVRYVTVTLPSAPVRPDSSNSNSSNLANIGKDSADVPPAADHFPDTAQTVMLPITQQVYRDTTYTAWVSGYRPQLDSIEVYPRTLIVRQTALPAARPRRWSFGIQAGYGYTPKGVQPYIGIGIGININLLNH